MKQAIMVTICMMVFSSIMASRTVQAQTEECYVLVEKAGNFDPSIVQSSAVSIISRYVEKVEVPPPSGLRIKDCTYQVGLTESMQGFFLSLSGRKINSVGDSRLQGIRGLTQALLRSVLRTLEAGETKKRICRDYSELLENDCRPVEALVFLFNDRGKMIRSGDWVRAGDRFNVMIQPVSALYAYIIACDSSNNMMKVFPNHRVSDQVNPLRAGRQYFFPPGNSDLIFSFDDNPGQERLYFLLTAAPLEDVDDFFRKLEGMDSDSDRRAEVPSFERTIATRGFRLKKSRKKVFFSRKNADEANRQQAVAELLEGSGILVKTITLQHLP
ncbi:MAG: DUF4384 domain-containing protein [Proteobacteria bacterium]|nr:DUF4384 domain-containing protein [Pseudomonadota bacterium]